jgi:hypothetical protein
MQFTPAPTLYNLVSYHNPARQHQLGSIGQKATGNTSLHAGETKTGLALTSTIINILVPMIVAALVETVRPETSERAWSDTQYLC